MKQSPDRVIAKPSAAVEGAPSLSQPDPRPGLDDTTALSDWILRRYVSSDWDNQFVERLELVLKRDRDGRLLPEPKLFHGEAKGIAMSGPAREGKTTLMQRVLERILGEQFDENGRGRHAVYCRAGSDATIKGVYVTLCKATGFTNFPARMTIPEAHALAIHRLRLADIRIIVLDEVHNLLGKNDRSVNVFLKTLLQDGGGFCLIVLGTEQLRSFIFDRSGNEELAGRLVSFPLEPFPRDDHITLIKRALYQLSAEAGLRLASSISRDPFFAERIYEGCRGSYGRSMRLVATSIVRAFEEGASCLDIEDFSRIFHLEFLHFNPENPFLWSDWATRAILVDDGKRPPGEDAGSSSVSDQDFGVGGTKRVRKSKRQSSRRAVA